MIKPFSQRHIGPNPIQQQKMLDFIGVPSLDVLIDKTVPEVLRQSNKPLTSTPLSELETLEKLRKIASQNKLFKNYIGQGYYNTNTPSVISRNILENPAWYTSYTPYQAEISQGRLEALANFQTLIIELTGLPYANASLLDEATAVAEAANICIKSDRKKRNRILVDSHLFPQTLAVLKTRAEPLNITLDIRHITPELVLDDSYSGIIIQNPDSEGKIADYSSLLNAAKQHKTLAVMVCDIMSLVLMKPPANMGADIAVGSSQRFGVPMGYGGPHAAYMACSESLKRVIPGRIVGLSKDKFGDPAYRLALQTREQHIRREKATSNICTAQALLAIIASFYAVYYGEQGLKAIAKSIHQTCCNLAYSLRKSGFEIVHQQFFDTVTIRLSESELIKLQSDANAQQLNFHYRSNNVSISVDEATTPKDLEQIIQCFTADYHQTSSLAIPEELLRKDRVLQNRNFTSYHSETELLRYMRKLADKDIALDRAMIPLGSCTMKLNATTEMLPITWPEFANLHPLAPLDQCQGYMELIEQLENDLAEITGYDSISLQPNAGSQGEYAGLLAIRAYHKDRGDNRRNLCIIPASAHGTNPASAAMCGMQTQTIPCDKQGNIDIVALEAVIADKGDQIAAIMLTYPSTHGVFEESIYQVCSKIHQCGGQVYIDGANLNAMIGLCQPGKFGGDVSHLNLHKTFCIPHGGGGPGVGPLGVAKHLAPYLPSHAHLNTQSMVGAVAAAPFGSASILPITWCYIKMMGQHIKNATEIAILNSNYIAAKLSPYYPILYLGSNGFTAHECILDCRQFKASANIEVEDIAKRLIDYSFHAPTMSFPVAGTLMVEPTESESLPEIDRFCTAMISIYKEIKDIEKGKFSRDNNPLKNAPHPAHSLMDEDIDISYSRTIAAYPVPSLKQNKYWAPVARVDNVYGDKNLFCGCS